MAHPPAPPIDPHRPDPASPAANPPPVPGRAVADLTERQPNEPPDHVPDTDSPPRCPDLPPTHPLGPPDPQARGR